MKINLNTNDHARANKVSALKIDQDSLKGVLKNLNHIDLNNFAKVNKYLRRQVLEHSPELPDLIQKDTHKVNQFLKQNGFKDILNVKLEEVKYTYNFTLKTKMGDHSKPCHINYRPWPVMTALLELKGQERLDMLRILIERGGMLALDDSETTHKQKALELSKPIIIHVIRMIIPPTYDLCINEKKELISFLIDTCEIDLKEPFLYDGCTNIIQDLTHHFIMSKLLTNPDDFFEMVKFISKKLGKEHCKKLYLCNKSGISARTIAFPNDKEFEALLGLNDT